MLKDFELSQDTMNLFVNNKSTIDISKNPVLHSRTKNIGIQHHFIYQLVEEKVMSLDYMKTKDQLVVASMMNVPKQGIMIGSSFTLLFWNAM